MCKAVVPEMKKRGGGAVVNNASMAAFYGFPVYAYSVSKAGAIGLAKSLAVSLAKDNIRVNCVAPGMIDTRMMAPSPRLGGIYGSLICGGEGSFMLS